MRMNCFVYRASKRQDTYVYLREREAFSLLPESLRSAFGELHFVMQLELRPDRPLAREKVELVLENLAKSGFHVQSPPPFPGLGAGA
jgi:uncharacterized protein